MNGSRPAKRRSVRDLVHAFRREVQVYRRILHDPRAPWPARACLALAAGYLFMPFDLIPDWIPGLGQLDDLIIVPGLVWLAVRLTPARLVEEHRRHVREETAGPKP